MGVTIEKVCTNELDWWAAKRPIVLVLQEFYIHYVAEG